MFRFDDHPPRNPHDVHFVNPVRESLNEGREPEILQELGTIAAATIIENGVDPKKAYSFLLDVWRQEIEEPGNLDTSEQFFQGVSNEVVGRVFPKQEEGQTPAGGDQ